MMFRNGFDEVNEKNRERINDMIEFDNIQKMNEAIEILIHQQKEVDKMKKINSDDMKRILKCVNSIEGILCFMKTKYGKFTSIIQLINNGTSIINGIKKELMMKREKNVRF